MHALPLFKPIPILITVTCKSKLLSESEAASDPTTFKFPRNPQVNDLEIALCLHSKIRAGIHRRTREDLYDLLTREGKTGHGTPAVVNFSSTDPVWELDGMKPGKGRWVESTTFNHVMIFRTPPQFTSQILSTSVEFFSIHAYALYLTEG
jgi:hypothetical protein